jgi:hypothetical protein
MNEEAVRWSVAMKRRNFELVLRHSDFDGLVLDRLEGWQDGLIDEYFDGSRSAGSS